MIIGVQDVYYYVQDMNRARRFYRDVLGLRVTYESDHWVSLDVGGTRLGLHWTGGAPVPHLESNSNKVQPGATLTFRISDIHAEVSRLRASGVKFLGELYEASWGSTIAFEDPDGNVLKFMEPAQEEHRVAGAQAARKQGR